MKIRNLAATALGVVVLGLSSGANATAFVRTFDVVASNFTQSFGFSPTPPLDPVHLNFTLTFDNSADIGITTTGLVINSFDLPYSAEWAYATGSDDMALATNLVASNSCQPDLGSFCMFLHNVTSGTPNVVYFQNMLPTNNQWIAQDVVVTYSDRGRIVGVDGGPGVPEPASWALMLMGFGGLGAVLRRRRRMPPQTLGAA